MKFKFRCFVFVFVVGLMVSSAALASPPPALARSVDDRADAALVTASAAAIAVKQCASELESARELAGKALASGRANKGYLDRLNSRVENLEKKFDEAMRRLVDSCAALVDSTSVNACLDLKKGEHATNDRAIAALWTGGGSVKKEVIVQVEGTETRTEREYFDSVVRSSNGRCVRKEMLRGADKSSGAGGLILRTEEGCDQASTAQDREVERLEKEASQRGWVTAVACVAEIGGGAAVGWAVGNAVRPAHEGADGSKRRSGGTIGGFIGGGAGLLACGATVLARHGNGEDEETASSGFSLTPTVSSGGGGFAFGGSF